MPKNTTRAYEAYRRQFAALPPEQQQAENVRIARFIIQRLLDPERTITVTVHGDPKATLTNMLTDAKAALGKE